jgi:hypothetical protein
MPAHRDTDTEAMIYVRLLDEGTDVWRPVRATVLPDGTFRLLEPNCYDPNAETWEFPHRLRCAALRESSRTVARASSRSHAAYPRVYCAAAAILVSRKAGITSFAKRSRSASWTSSGCPGASRR